MDWFSCNFLLELDLFGASAYRGFGPQLSRRCGILQAGACVSYETPAIKLS